MKAVAFNGSPRKDGNTTLLITHVLRELENEGFWGRLSEAFIFTEGYKIISIA